MDAAARLGGQAAMALSTSAARLHEIGQLSTMTDDVGDCSG